MDYKISPTQVDKLKLLHTTEVGSDGFEDNIATSPRMKPLFQGTQS